MFWIRTGLHALSISDCLTPPRAADSEPPLDLGDLRAAMLDALGEIPWGRPVTLVRRILAARHVESLWDLRPDLMTAVSRLHGEAEGRRRLASLSALFDELRPARRPARGRTAVRVASN